jgi:hypothetical protein
LQAADFQAKLTESPLKIERDDELSYQKGRERLTVPSGMAGPSKIWPTKPLARWCAPRATIIFAN